MDEFISRTENSVINLLSAVAPWLVPIIPAYLTYWHAIRELDFPDWVAWCAAVVVEILGFASVRTSISFWEHNKRYKADKNQAPVGVAIIIYAVYLVIILTVNVLLDITSHVRWDKIVAVGLFSLMSFPAGLLIAIRTQHRELLDELSERRKSAKVSGNSSESGSKGSENSQKDPENDTKVSGNFPKDWRRLRPLLKHEQVVGIAQLSPSEVRTLATRYNVTERTIQNWRVQARNELNMN